VTAAAATNESTTDSERPRRGWSEARRKASEQRRQGAAASSRPDPELIAEEVIGDAVANVITLAGFVMPFAPYTAVTLAGVPGEEAGTWVVRSRAEMAGAVLLEHAKRNNRVLAAVHRFNLLFKNVELAEVVGSVVASVAVDAHVIPPDATMALPGGMKLPILAPAIGDTIAYIAGQEEAAHAAGHVRLDPDAGIGGAGQAWEHIAGAPTQPTPEQLAAAHAARERRRARDERIANGEEPTVRREGQTVIPGGVTDT